MSVSELVILGFLYRKWREIPIFLTFICVTTRDISKGG